MTEHILWALALLLLHVWAVPMVLKMKHMDWMLSARDEPLEVSVTTGRAQRAATNYLESLPAFLALVLLAMIREVDVSQLACYWLIARLVYLPCYLLGLPYVRSGVWIASLVCLVFMAVSLT